MFGRNLVKENISIGSESIERDQDIMDFDIIPTMAMGEDSGDRLDYIGRSAINRTSDLDDLGLIILSHSFNTVPRLHPLTKSTPRNSS